MLTPSPPCPSNRVKVFEILQRNPEGLSALEIRQKIHMSSSSGQLGVILRGEVFAERFSCFPEQRDSLATILIYRLTRKGVRALQEGTIDSVARELGLIAVGRDAKE
jgi:hypothetical protein